MSIKLSGTSVATQYLWSAVYVDAMVLRDQDSGTDGTLDERLYAQQDANFNVTSVIDTSGTVVERYTYEAFGQFTVIDADWSSDADGQSDVNWVHLHQGGRWDKNAKLYHFGARDYDPELNRWMQPDYAVGYADGMNLYQYERSSPTGMLDPMGTFGEQAELGGSGSARAVAIEKPSDASRVSHSANATTQPATNKAKDQSGLNNGTGTCTTKKCPATQPQWGYLGADGLWHDPLTDRLRRDQATTQPTRRLRRTPQPPALVGIWVEGSRLGHQRIVVGTRYGTRGYSFYADNYLSVFYNPRSQGTVRLNSSDPNATQLAYLPTSSAQAEEFKKYLESLNNTKATYGLIGNSCQRFSSQMYNAAEERYGPKPPPRVPSGYDIDWTIYGPGAS